jgi:hypothetical protein
MLHLLALALIGGVIWVTLHALPLFLVGGMGFDDVRNLLLHRAYGSFTYEGDLIPGVRPSAGARLVIRALSTEDDARTDLVVKAMAGFEPWWRTGDGAAMSRALREARWFSAPPLGAQFRAR